MKFLTLIEIEIKKVLPWLATLFIGLITVSGGLFYYSINNYKTQILPEIMNSSVSEYVEQYGQLSLVQIFDQTPYLPIFYIFTALLLVCITFYLWYKEWFGTSKRIYLLLSLKGHRFFIFLSKLVVILLSFFIFYGVILLNLGIASLLMTTILPKGTVTDLLISGVMQQSQLIGMILPLSIGDFIYKIAFIILMFSLISVFVLCDRSKKIFGIIVGIIFVIANITLFIYTKTLYLYFDERLFVNYGFVFGMSAISIFICGWLLNKKVSI